MQLYHYHLMLFPLDWEFCFFNVDEYKTLINKKYQQTKGYSQYLAGNITTVSAKIDQIYNLAWQQYKHIIKETGVKDKLRCEPLLFPIPDSDCTASFAVIFKMDDEGDTFVFSPIPLPHLISCE